jgi:cellulose synthase (UDP-forming)
MYASTIWSYLASTWNVIFLLAPVVYLFTGIAPLETYSFEFLKRAIPFFVMVELATMVGVWGVASWQGQSMWMALFPVNLRAMWTVIRGRRIGFPVTPKLRQEGTFGRLVWPQIAIIVLTLSGLAYAGSLVWLGVRHDMAAFSANVFWALNNVFAMSAIVRAAYRRAEA